MPSPPQRAAILDLCRRGQSIRQIAYVLELSSQAVWRVIVSQSSEPPRILRPQKAEPYVSPTLAERRTEDGEEPEEGGRVVAGGDRFG